MTPLKKDNRGYDLRQLLIGAEGTLGLVTAASLKLVPAVGERAVAWVGLDSAEGAMRLLRDLEARLGDAVESFELVPKSALDLVLEHVPGTRPPLARAAPWNVLVEAVSAAPDAAPLPRRLARRWRAASSPMPSIAASEAQAEDFWRLRDSISEAEKKDGPAAKHDISVAVEEMAGFMTEAAAAVEARFPGHPGQRLRPSRRRQCPFQRPRARGRGRGLGRGGGQGGLRLRPRSRHRRPAARSRPSTASAR